MIRIVLFSSSESYKIVEEVILNLSRFYKCDPWNRDFFEISHTTIDSLNDKIGEYDYSIIILNKDDKRISRENTEFVPRDNVIFEMGLSVGALGMENTIIIQTSSVSIPSDLAGLTVLLYSDTTDFPTAINAACIKIQRYIDNRTIAIKWSEYQNLLINLNGKLCKTNGYQGFYYDIIIGINRAGGAVADFLTRASGSYCASFCLFVDRRREEPYYDTSFVNEHNMTIINYLKSERISNILVVDDIARTGLTIKNAKQFLIDKLPDKNIKSAVLIADEQLDNNVKIDFFATKKKTKLFKMPYFFFD